MLELGERLDIQWVLRTMICLVPEFQPRIETRHRLTLLRGPQHWGFFSIVVLS